jgi:hypothetical protein
MDQVLWDFNFWISWTNSTNCAPSPTALQTGLGTLATLAGIYKSFNPNLHYLVN